METIGERVRYLRQQHNFSMDELAQKLLIPTKDDPNILRPTNSTTISNIENNKNKPSADILIALKKYMNVSIDWLLTGENNYETKFKSLKLGVKQTTTFPDTFEIQSELNNELLLEVTNTLNEQADKIANATKHIDLVRAMIKDLLDQKEQINTEKHKGAS